jgi:hypothetical protein
VAGAMIEAENTNNCNPYQSHKMSGYCWRTYFKVLTDVHLLG